MKRIAAFIFSQVLSAYLAVAFACNDRVEF